ncbi:MAG: hypothetical protein K0Q54_5031, partial [Methylobacterium brachiatum]|nr:hypothetical protein [Methylobacterium brachiatum]
MVGDAFTRDLIAWQNQVVADRELTPLAFHVAYVIGQHLNRESRDAWPSQVRLAEILQVNERSVRNAVEQLRSRGHLSVTVRHGRGDSNRYRIILKNRNEDSAFGSENRNAASGIKPGKRNADAGFEQRNRNGGSKETGTSVPPNHLKEPSERGYIPPTPEHAFDRFWRAFPKHEAEDGARRAFDRLMRDGQVDPEQLVEAAGRYAVEVQGKHPDHIASAKNWLLDGRWKDPARPRSPV